MTLYPLHIKKWKINATVSEGKLPNWKEVLRQFDLCMEQISASYDISCLTQIQAWSLDFGDIGIVDAQKAHIPEYFNIETNMRPIYHSIDSLVETTPIKYEIDKVLNKYNLEVERIKGMDGYGERVWWYLSRKDYLKSNPTEEYVKIPDIILQLPVTMTIKPCRSKRE